MSFIIRRVKSKFFFFFWPCREACGILVTQPGIEHVPPAVEVWSLNHWIAREVPKSKFFAWPIA